MKNIRKAIALNFPTHGCINPLLATITELVNRGEKIIYYCTEEFKSKIEQTGAEFRPYSGLINKFKIENDDLSKALKLNVKMTVDKLDHNLKTILKENPDYIIHDSLCTWGKYLASILRLPAVNLMHSFPVTESSISFSKETALLLTKVYLYKIKNNFSRNSPKKILKKKYNINLSVGDTLINRENLNIVYTSKSMEPDIYKSEKTFKFVGPSLFFRKEQTDFPFDKLKGRKVIYISLGTLHNNNSAFYNTCIKAFTDSEYNVVISIGFEINPGGFSDLPNNFIIRQSVPQQKLLDKVDLFITHAGMNSVNEAICSGVPMLLLPHQIEQKMIAQRVREMEIGNVMKIKKVTPTNLVENAEKLISDPEFKKQAIKYKSIFRKEEKISHIKAADKILSYINKLS
jgi:MGT family glycosyltransferase